MTAPLRRVFVRRPGGVERWQEFGWRAEPDPIRIVDEHEGFVEALEGAGVEVVVGEPLDSALDAIYVHDPAAVTSSGVVLLRPGKELRQVEVDAIERDLTAAGIDVIARLEAPATAEGGDMLWLDDRTLVVGRGYRTNDAGIDALLRALPDVEVLAVDLPHYHGRDEVMHMLSLVSPLADDLAVVYLPLMPVRLVELLEERGVAFVEVPDEEFESMACNVLALGPRRALTLDGNPETRRRLEAAGVEVLVYAGDELSRKGDGGPTCLTRPLARAK
ncbi:MAG TPA: arginine deiminase family protein [Gaiellaceae bacterium]|nr:arginine deiminase family protein [Gaiellaceae bacterium]